MFQEFAVRTAPETGAPRLAALRAEIARRGIDGFLVPRADAHQGEFVADRDARLAWLTGFTGSAGTCAVLAGEAALFVDGRYTLQAKSQSDMDIFALQPVPQVSPADWLAERMTTGQTLAYDPWLHVRKDIETLERKLGPKGVALVPTENLIDAVWTDQPPPPRGRVVPHPEDLAGKPHRQKRAEIAAELTRNGLRAHVLSLPDSLCWLLNIRGADIERSPYVHAFAILHDDARVSLFIDAAKLDDAVRTHLGDEVSVAAPDALDAALARLEGPVGLDPASAPVRFAQALEAAGTRIEWARDPCILPKACKTGAELNGIRAAHLRDGAAVTGFLHWLDTVAPQGGLTEIDVVRELEARRRATNALKDISFETICGAGEHGAIVHYRVNEATNRAVRVGELLLVDSGGQYADGTTDITRTVAIGPADPHAMKPFTLVLKGMIAISRARWPEGLAGRDLDALARIALWQAGMDYDHGTGHGVGAYLGVHEGPQNLSRRGVEPLLPGMILSNEPGYYREGAFGIRIENLVAVTPPAVPEGGDRAMLGFETLSLAPIDRRLILPELLTAAERDWLNAYHARVRAELSPLLPSDTAAWLAEVTAPV